MRGLEPPIPLRLFFAVPWPSRKRRGRTLSGRDPRADGNRATRRVHPSIAGVSSWSPNRNVATSAGHAVVPTAREPRTAPRSPPPHLVFRLWPSSAAYPGSDDSRTTWDLVGQVFTPFSPGAPTTHPACRPWRVAHPTDSGWSKKTPQPQRFRRVRTLAPTHGRIMTPPGVPRPGHFNAALTGRPWLPPPPEESSSRDCCTGTNPHREDLAHRPHRLRLGMKILRLTRTPTPYHSGDSARDQGITKSGNRHVRWMTMELAWSWLRYQPGSALSGWFRERFGGGGKRLRRIGIVAVARKLRIALWRFLETGVLPEGAELKEA